MRRLIFFTLLFVWLGFGGIEVEVKAQSNKIAEFGNAVVIQQWDYLEVSSSTTCGTGYDTYKPCRYFNFFSIGSIIGKDSLDWIGINSWELVTAYSFGENGGGNRLIFKRPYDLSRTQKDVEDLKKAFERQPNLKFDQNTQEVTGLIDLDVIDAKDSLAAFNKKEEDRLSKILTQFNTPNMKLINIKSSAYRISQSNIAAEFVVDGTSVLLKDGNKYRTSEARKYLQEVSQSILNLQGLRTGATSLTEYRFEVGKLYNGNPITIGVSVVINFQGTQKVVAQGYAQFNWADNSN